MAGTPRSAAASPPGESAPRRASGARRRRRAAGSGLCRSFPSRGMPVSPISLVLSYSRSCDVSALSAIFRVQVFGGVPAAYLPTIAETGGVFLRLGGGLTAGWRRDRGASCLVFLKFPESGAGCPLHLSPAGGGALRLPAPPPSVPCPSLP